MTERKSSLKLPQRPTLQDFQAYAAQMKKERGFEKESVQEMFMLFLEECGEMAKAARKAANLTIDSTSEQFSFNHEAADVFIYLLCLCNHFGIDLEQSFRDKEEINKKRVWG